MENERQDFDSSNIVQVSVQSAEIAIIGHNTKPDLVVNGTLKNLARGNMNLTIRAGEHVHVGGIGTLEIEEHRPVMQANAAVAPHQFDHLLLLLRGSLPRPASVILALQEKILISPEGVILLEERRKFNISDLSWNIPIL
ncbi:hypothetical protein [Planktotalea arctica]|uniref:hypothetical protein n=1 Tax=Planktotalea arctica TaxID=1481893 RepID=UPI000A16CD8D|nr:hypothetical protein [Planktotalea arctica]